MLTFWISLHGYIIFMFLTTASKGSTCEAPSSPECFRRNASETVYTCEWSTSTTNSNVTFDLYFNKKKFGSIKATSWPIPDELLIKNRPVNISVEAHVDNLSCMSPWRTVELGNIVKYDAPHSISMSWSKNDLVLMWSAAETSPSLAEVWFRRHEHPSESWEKRLINTTLLTARKKISTSWCPKKGLTPGNQVTIGNLTKHSIYQVQIRHRSNLVKSPLWSKWSPVVIVPAELEYKPQVNVTTKLLKGSREVTLTWKPMPHTAAEVTYRLEYTLSSLRCSCPRAAWRRHPITTNNYKMFVPYSAVKISVTARNAAGCSPPAIVQVPAVPIVNLKMCDKTSKHTKKMCKQWYEFQEPDSENVTSASERKLEPNMEPLRRTHLQAYFGYMYYEHMCDGGRPRTVKTCLFYKKEGAPQREPPDFSALSETHNSTTLSWKVIPSVDRRGFLTHYRLCSVEISSADQPTECRNISASLTKYHLENLTPGAKYSISLAGVTQVGEGPKATVTVNTWQEKHVNVWWSFGLLFVFFFITTTCTIILKRIRNKVFPPVPTPVIPDFSSSQLEGQQMQEEKEEVHDLMLQLHPEGKSAPDNAEETTVSQHEWSHKEVENDSDDSRTSGGSSDESPGSTDDAPINSGGEEITDLEQLDNEIAILIYRNGLVFDVKTDSP
uniref:interleukin-12 receptor subunit beta-2 isoform X3 n=1 Tax=Solea senegalensis TaxID=28829 RepID=UPI001CD8A8AD|nr:interleukin-12 receptor subunit beta-2 isoform X3 [Solea senegalensis]